MPGSASFVIARAMFAREFLAFCLAAVHFPVANHQGDGHWLSSKAFMPGSSLPSRNSKVAPPPVDKWVIFSATPAAVTAATVSPPAMMLTMPGKFSANALAKSATSLIVGRDFEQTDWPVPKDQSAGFDFVSKSLRGLRADVEAHSIRRNSMVAGRWDFFFRRSPSHGRRAK